MLEHLLWAIVGTIAGFLGGVGSVAFLWKRVNGLALRLEQHFQEAPDGFTESECDKRRKMCRVEVNKDTHSLSSILLGDGTMANPGLAAYVRETRNDVKRIWQHLQNGGAESK